MATTLSDIRRQYPQYNDMSDDQLAHAFHDKFYADMPFDQFSQRIGYVAQPADNRNPATNGIESYLDLGTMSIKQRPSDPFVAGVGKAFADTGAGLKQLALKAGNRLGLVSDQTVAQNQLDIDNQRALDKPLDSTTAGKVGQFAGDAAMLAAAPAEGLIGSAAGGAAVSGAQPTSGDESPLANAAVGGVGGAAGYGVGKLVGKTVIQPISDSLSDAGKWARSILAREGVPLDAAQATG